LEDKFQTLASFHLLAKMCWKSESYSWLNSLNIWKVVVRCDQA